MYIKFMGSCMWREICYIQGSPSAKAAMIDFCKLNRKVKEGKSYKLSKGVELDPNLANLYAFTAVVGYRGLKGMGRWEHGTPSYGPAFAEFIKKNKLGKLIETWDGLWNKNHPNHKIKVWLWNPSFRALSKWWEENRPTNIIETAYLYTYDKPHAPACVYKELQAIAKGKGRVVEEAEDEDGAVLDLVGAAAKVKKVKKVKP